MMCDFDRNQIALYAGADLPAGEVACVEAHLQTCAECRTLLAQYREGLRLVAASGAEARCPEMALPRRPSRTALRWTAAAAVALVTLGAVGWFTGAPAVAALLRSFGFDHVRVSVLTDQEAQAYQEQLQERADRHSGDQPEIPMQRLTLTEAAQAVDYHLLQPAYLPDGYSFDFALADPENRQSFVTIAYRGPGGSLTVRQAAPGAMVMHNQGVPEGAAQETTVLGKPAVVIRGGWVVAEGKAQWWSNFNTEVTFVRDDQLITVRHGRADYPVEELIKVAESLK